MKNKKYALLLIIAITLLCSVMLALNTLAADEASTVKTGDVNADGVVDTKDIILLRQYLANYDYDSDKPGIKISDMADMNNDGKIGAQDLGLIRKQIVDNPAEEPIQDNVFDGADIYAAYNYDKPESFKGEIVTENGVTFFRATATEAKQGTLVLNTGKNTVTGVGKSFVVVLRNKTAAINRIQLGINSAGKTNNQGGASPFYSVSKSNDWTAVYFKTTNAVDLTNGAGYISIDVFDDDNNNNTKVGDVIEIALVAIVDSEETAKNVVGQYCGNIIKFPYTVDIPGVYAYGTNYKGSDVLVSEEKMTDSPVEIDLSTLPISGNLTSALKLGAGWAVTRGGWDYYECKITADDGTTSTIRISEGADFAETSGTLSNLKMSYEASYGADFAIGGNLFNPLSIDLTGYMGKTVTLEVYGISNFGMSYKLANIKNVNIPKLDNVFTAQDLYTAHRTNPAATFTSQLLTEDGVTFFRATAVQDGAGRLILNNGSDSVPGVGKHFILVYRNTSETGNRFDVFMNKAGTTSGGINPYIGTSKSSENWKILVFKTSQEVDLTNGAGYMAIDFFNAKGVVGDTFDVALFAAVEDEAAAWAVFDEVLGDKIALPYLVNIAGISVNGTTYGKDDTAVLPNGVVGSSAPILMDLSSISLAANSNLTNCLKFGQGWAITRGGWDYYICKITAESGKTATVYVSDGADFPADSGTLNNNLKPTYEPTYGPDMALGGNIMAPVYMYFDLSGFEGEKVSLDVIGVSNYGMEYSIANIVNVLVPGTLAYDKVDGFVSFVDYTKASDRKIEDIADGSTYGVSFTVPAGEQVNTFRVNLANDNNMKACSINVSIYSFAGNYANAVATEPIYSETFTSVIRCADVHTELGAGNYLVVVKYISESGALSTVVLDNAWSAETLPEEYKKYNIVSYKNGAVDDSKVLFGGILVETLGAVSPADDTISATFSDTVAKVIVIAGQSNASGTTKNSYLQQNISAEDYAKYENGFSNVKIYYTCGMGSSGVSHTQVVNEFVEVKIGQGTYSWLYGPELALAAYLSENYPDEQFYIIKYAIGGTAMDIQWNATSTDKRQCLNELEDKVDGGLELLKAKGLDPEMLAFIWMQGEGDANPASRTEPYYGYQKALMAELREKYADYSVEGDIPFIDTEINDEGFWAASYMINDAKNEIARESARNYIIDSNYYGLTALYENNDLAHYDSMSMILLGRLYAQKICSIYDFSAK